MQKEGLIRKTPTGQITALKDDEQFPVLSSLLSGYYRETSGSVAVRPNRPLIGVFPVSFSCCGLAHYPKWIHLVHAMLSVFLLIIRPGADMYGSPTQRPFKILACYHKKHIHSC